MQLQLINQGLVFQVFIYLLFLLALLLSLCLSPHINIFFLATPKVFGNFHFEENASFPIAAMTPDTARNTSFQ